MKISYYANHRVIHCEEFFTQEEYDEMWIELCTLCTDELLVNSSEAKGATNMRGQQLRFNRGLFIETVMEQSSIRDITNKIFVDEISEEFIKRDIGFESLKNKTIY